MTIYLGEVCERLCCHPDIIYSCSHHEFRTRDIFLVCFKNSLPLASFQLLPFLTYFLINSQVCFFICKYVFTVQFHTSVHSNHVQHTTGVPSQNHFFYSETVQCEGEQFSLWLLNDVTCWALFIRSSFYNHSKGFVYYGRCILTFHQMELFLLFVCFLYWSHQATWNMFQKSEQCFLQQTTHPDVFAVGPPLWWEPPSVRDSLKASCSLPEAGWFETEGPGLLPSKHPPPAPTPEHTKYKQVKHQGRQVFFFSLQFIWHINKNIKMWSFCCPQNIHLKFSIKD